MAQNPGQSGQKHPGNCGFRAKSRRECPVCETNPPPASAGGRPARTGPPQRPLRAHQSGQRTGRARRSAPYCKLTALGQEGLDAIRQVISSVEEVRTDAIHQLADVKLVAPWPGKRIAMVGGNYARHLLEMVYSFGECAEALTRDLTLAPGDILSGGTGAGTAIDIVGLTQKDAPESARLFLKPGDVVEVSSPQIGAFSNQVIGQDGM
jgi:2-keto-4-pentenoate hydratase/2-oxohepta-3-ene-1,7-dioic acid hydratase in catechol pathway